MDVSLADDHGEKIQGNREVQSIAGPGLIRQYLPLPRRHAKQIA